MSPQRIGRRQSMVGINIIYILDLVFGIELRHVVDLVADPVISEKRIRHVVYELVPAIPVKGPGDRFGLYPAQDPALGNGVNFRVGRYLDQQDTRTVKNV